MLSWFSIKNPKSYLVFPPLNSRGRSGECIYTGSSVKKTKEEEKKKKSPPKRLMCVNIYISLYLFLSRINNTRLSSRSRSFIFILLLFFSVVWAMFFFNKVFPLLFLSLSLSFTLLSNSLF